MFLADGSAAPALGRLGDALRAAGTTPEPVSVVLVRPAGTIGIETATAIRAFSREFPRTRLLVHEDIQGGWSRLLRVPAGPAAGGAVRVVDAARRLAFQGDRSVDAEALARALGRLDAGGAPGRARPLIPIVGPGVRPRDLLVELVPGSPISLRHLRRRPLALAFAREWSVPCRAALQELASAHRRLAEGGITVVGVLAGAGADHAKTFGAREGLPFPVVADPDAALARSCEICLWPTVLWMEGGHVRARAGASSAALAAWSQGGRTGPVS
jgi:peroxiredoxin